MSNERNWVYRIVRRTFLDRTNPIGEGPRRTSLKARKWAPWLRNVSDGRLSAAAFHTNIPAWGAWHGRRAAMPTRLRQAVGTARAVRGQRFLRSRIRRTSRQRDELARTARGTCRRDEPVLAEGRRRRRSVLGNHTMNPITLIFQRDPWGNRLCAVRMMCRQGWMTGVATRGGQTPSASCHLRASTQVATRKD